MYKKIIFSTILLLTTSMSHAYCIYNDTVGNNTIDSTTKKRVPTYIKVHKDPTYTSKIIAQKDFKCDITGPRKENDKTGLLIKVVNVARGAGSDTTEICRVDVFNKGGYVMVTGTQDNTGLRYSCTVHRDPN